MNKTLQLIGLSLAFGVIITGASFVVATTPPGSPKQCLYVPNPSNPLSELSSRLNTQKQHGFPFAYYTEHADESCQESFSTPDRPVEAKKKPAMAALDVAVWATVFGVTMYAVSRSRK
jgi:hypothetical protein